MRVTEILETRDCVRDYTYIKLKLEERYLLQQELNKYKSDVRILYKSQINDIKWIATFLIFLVL